jgi:hypothetical protein
LEPIVKEIGHGIDLRLIEDVVLFRLRGYHLPVGLRCDKAPEFSPIRSWEERGDDIEQKNAELPDIELWSVLGRRAMEKLWWQEWIGGACEMCWQWQTEIPVLGIEKTTDFNRSIARVDDDVLGAKSPEDYTGTMELPKTA